MIRLKSFLNHILYLLILSPVFYNYAQQKDVVNGNLIQFNDNGFWCWFQDERAVVDTAIGKLIIGSAACSNGVGGSSRSGFDEAVIYDLKTGSTTRYYLGTMTNDDHNAPGISLRPDGKYIAMYSDHYDKYKNRYRIFDGKVWSPEQSYDWQLRPLKTDYTIAYNNVYYLSAEKTMYDFSRANHRTPNFLISTDMGDTWNWGGQLTTNKSNSYNKGYYKYWGNGVDRIDFIFTEQHPRDTLTSIYHGYIKGGKAYRSDGTVVDNDIRDTSYIPQFLSFTKVFGNGTKIGNNTYYRCWTSDLMRYADGTIAAIISSRINQKDGSDASINPQHAFFYCKYDGAKWSSTFLGKAGYKFYSSEADYVGLGALVPNDPTTLYISTSFDPRDTTKNLGKREIFKGVTSDKGDTWTWSAITQNSTRDNMRPIVPAWNKNNVALLWCRGSYISAQIFDAAVVGIVMNKNEKVGLMNYVDASFSNTTFSDGSVFTATGPDASEGTADKRWHERTGFGNGGSVFTSSEVYGEVTQPLKTTITFPQDGTYDVWVNFWADPTADWRIKAGFVSSSIQIFRQMACKQVEDGAHTTKLILSGDQNTFLYQAYIGRVKTEGSKKIDVYIEDQPYKTGTATLTGNTVRTWYDGISYATVTNSIVDVAREKSLPAEFNLEQNFPNPFNPSTTIRYQIPIVDALSVAEVHVSLKVYDVLGREVATLVNEYKQPGTYEVKFDSRHVERSRSVTSGLYFYTLQTENFISTKKMILLK